MINNNINNIQINIEESVNDVGYMIEISVNHEERQDSGHCTGNIDDAIEMATQITKELLSKHI